MNSEPLPRTVAMAGLLAFFLLGAVMVWGASMLQQPGPLSGPRTPETPGGLGHPLEREIVCDTPVPDEGEEEATEASSEGGLRETESLSEASSVIRAVTSTQLYDCPSTFDGQLVAYTGEAVGQGFERDGELWVMLNDDAYAALDRVGSPTAPRRDFRGGNAGLGVVMAQEDGALITSYGGPDGRGDVVSVVGVFHRHDPDTGEVAVLRAREVRILLSGVAFDPPPYRQRMVLATLLAVLAASLWFNARRSSR